MTTPQSFSARVGALTDASDSLRNAAGGREVVHCVLEAAASVIPADAFAIWRFDADQRHWHIAASRGLSQSYVGELLAQPRAQRSLEQPFFVDDVDGMPDNEPRRLFYERENIRSFLVIPLRIRTDAASGRSALLTA